MIGGAAAKRRVSTNRTVAAANNASTPAPALTCTDSVTASPTAGGAASTQ